MTLSIGTKLGPYNVLSAIGAGGMGAVWKAWDTRLDRTVAIKTIDGKFTERFEREAKTIASLNHPHICTLFDVGENYLVMEHIEGAPLKGPLPVAEVVRLGAQIAEALDEAHRKGITHRDLKPGNVLVTKSGAKVIDFGLAKGGSPIRGQQDVTLTKPITGEGTILGTVPYMSPEQLQGQEADARSDIWALGCVLYEMVTGKRAFEGKSQVSIMAAILEHEPAPSSVPVVPPWVDRIIRRCLRKNPDDRWQNARDIAIELRDAHTEPAAAVSHRRPWLPWAVAGVCAITAAGAWIARPGKQKAAPLPTYQIEVFPPEGMGFRELSAGSYNISPDGETLAVVSRDARGVFRLYLRSLRDGGYRLLAGTDDARYPFFSPDGRWVGYRTSGGALYKIATGGGSRQHLADIGSAGGRASWGADGVILFTKSSNASLWRVNETGGSESPVFRDESPGFSPWFLPDGRQFLFSAAGAAAFGTIGSPAPKELLLGLGDAIYAPAGKSGEGYVLYVSSAQLLARPVDPGRARFTGDPIPILDGAPPGPALAASLNGNLAVRRSGGPTSQLKWVDRAGKVISALGEPGPISRPAISPDGKQIAYTLGTGNDERVWLMDSERGVAARLTTSNERERESVWSRDGRLAYTVNRKVILHAPGGTPEEVPAANGCGALYAWLPGKQGFLCSAGAGTSEHFPVEGAKAKISSGGNIRENQVQVAPQGQWFALASSETGRLEVYIRPLPPQLGGPPGGAKIRVSPAGGTAPRWRGDGRELFYLSGDTLMAVAVEDLGSGLRVGKPKEFFQMRSYLGAPNHFPFDVAADGKRFIVMEPLIERSAVPITVIVNWPGLLDSRKSERE